MSPMPTSDLKYNGEVVVETSYRRQGGGVFKTETVRARITAKRIKAIGLTFDRQTGQEIRSAWWWSYRHTVKSEKLDDGVVL
jgi:hypothetical protein